MAPSNPLIWLLDGLISQNRDQIQEAMAHIRNLLQAQLESPFVSIGTESESDLDRVVSALMDAHPHLASMPDPDDGSLPLHFAASMGNLGVANLVLAKYPRATQVQNKKGKVPLHFAAREGHDKMVCFLLSVNPESANIVTTKNKLPLHFAVGEGHSTIVRHLLQCQPHGANVRSSKGKLPLHFAARWGHMSIAQQLLKLNPRSVSALDWEGSLPLHDAAREGQANLAKYLMHVYPQGLAVANMRGEIPLFPAVLSGNMDVTIALIQAWPLGGKFILQRVSAEDNVPGWNPDILELCLRGACENFRDCRLLKGRQQSVLCLSDCVMHSEGSESNSFHDVLDESQMTGVTMWVPLPVDGHALVDAPSLRCESNPLKRPASFPLVREQVKSMRQETLTQLSYSSPSCEPGGKFLALHASLACDCSPDVIRCVLKRFPEQLTEIDCFGQLPLHVAMAHCRNEESIDVVIQQILKPYPEALHIRDMEGRLPLHVGLSSQAYFRLMEPVLEGNPLSGYTPCQTHQKQYTDKLPLFMAINNDCDVNVIYRLLRGDPSVLQAFIP